jgi:hypothetical protein
MNAICPTTGSGVHTWLLSEANRCRNRGLQQDTVAAVLRDGSRTCGRRVPESEIVDAVRTAFRSTWTPSRTAPCSPPKPRWPERDERRIAELAAADRRTIGALKHGGQNGT